MDRVLLVWVFAGAACTEPGQMAAQDASLPSDGAPVIDAGRSDAGLVDAAIEGPDAAVDDAGPFVPDGEPMVRIAYGTKASTSLHTAAYVQTIYSSFQATSPVEVSGPHGPSGQTSVRMMYLSADGSVLAYSARQASQSSWNLYADAGDASQPHGNDLVGPQHTDGTGAPHFRFSPVGTRMVYISDISGTDRLYVSDAADTNAAPILVSGTPAFAGGILDVRWFPAGDRLWFAGDQEGVRRPYIVDVSGQGPYTPTPIDIPLPTFVQPRRYVELSPDGTKLQVVSSEGRAHLVDVSQQVPGEPVAILPETYDAGLGTFTPTSDNIVFQADGPDGKRLYRVAISGQTIGEPIDISGPFIPAGNVKQMYLSPDGDRLAYRADQEVYERSGLYVADLTSEQATTAVRVSPEYTADSPSGAGYGNYAHFSPDGVTMLMMTDLDALNLWELYAVDVSGAQPGVAVKLHPAIDYGQNIVLADITDSGDRVLYLADYADDNTYDLYMTELSNGMPGAEVKVSGDFVSGGSVITGLSGLPPQFLPGDSAVLYLGHGSSLDYASLYMVHLSQPQPAAPIVLNGDLLTPNSLQQLQVVALP